MWGLLRGLPAFLLLLAPSVSGLRTIDSMVGRAGMHGTDRLVEASAAESGTEGPACYQDLAKLADSQAWLVQANANYDNEMTESKCLQLCSVKRVLPLVILQNLGACYCAKALPANLSSAATKLPLSDCVSVAGALGCPGNRSVSCGTESAALVINTTHGLKPVLDHRPPAPPAPPGPTRAKLPLLPYPKSVTVLGPTRVPTTLAISVATDVSAEVDVPTLISDLRGVNVTGAPASATLSATPTAATLTLRTAVHMEREQYSLQVNQTEWIIVGGSSTAVWWGTRTLLQVFTNGGGSEAQAVRIEDAPLVAHRSLMVDCAREHLSLAFHLATIKKLSSMKMSAYHLHLSDDSGYALPSSVFPNISSPQLSLALADWKTIVETAHNYHVELVPELDLPGHSQWLAGQLPELLGPNCTKGRSWCPIDCRPSQLNRTVEIVSSIFTEVFEIFVHSKYHHLGADEVYEDPSFATLCKCSPKPYLRNGSTQLHFVESTGADCSVCILNGKAGYHAFINRMHRFVKGKGRQTILWEGFDPNPAKLGQQDVVETIDHDVLVSPFDVAHHDGWDRTPIDYFLANYSIVNSAWAPLYVCPGGSMSPPEHLVLWDPTLFGGPNAPTPPGGWQRLPSDDWWGLMTQAWAGSYDGWPITSAHPASGGAPPNIPNQIHGAEMCAWQLPEQCLGPLLFAQNCSTKGCAGQGRPAPRVAIVAERSWGSGQSADDLLERTGCGYS